MTFTTYLLIGTAFMLFVDFLLSTKKTNRTRLQLGFLARILGILLWPIALLTFVYGFFKESFFYLKGDKSNETNPLNNLTKEFDKLQKSRKKKTKKKKNKTKK